MMKGRMKSGYSCRSVPPDDCTAAAADTLCCTARLQSQLSSWVKVVFVGSSIVAIVPFHIRPYFRYAKLSVCSIVCMQHFPSALSVHGDT